VADLDGPGGVAHGPGGVAEQRLLLRGGQARYEKRWQDRLGQELRVADWLRGVVAGSSDTEIDALVAALGSDDVQAVIRRTVRFNWHRDVILAMLRQRGIKSLLVRALFR
jgi:hypothetical protein